MNDPYRPPIASPDGNLAPLPAVPLVAGDWKSAPKIVRNWAYQLSWLGIIFLPLVFIGSIVAQRSGVGGDRTLFIALYAVLWGVDIWLNRALKKGAPAAWVVQIILSVLGLLAFPVGTLIHAYVLSQWFKPENRAWFQQN